MSNIQHGIFNVQGKNCVGLFCVPWHYCVSAFFKTISIGFFWFTSIFETVTYPDLATEIHWVFWTPQGMLAKPFLSVCMVWPPLMESDVPVTMAPLIGLPAESATIISGLPHPDINPTSTMSKHDIIVYLTLFIFPSSVGCSVLDIGYSFFNFKTNGIWQLYAVGYQPPLATLSKSSS